MSLWVPFAVPRSRQLAPDTRRRGRWLLLVLVLLPWTPRAVLAERQPIRAYTAADGLAGERVKRIYRDTRGFLWFCSSGLSRFDGRSFATYSIADGLPHSSINDLLETRAGVFWIATNGGGLARLNARTQANSGRPTTGTAIFTPFAVGETPRSARVNVLYEDRAGVVWLGTDGGLHALETTGDEVRIARRPLDLAAHPDAFLKVWTVAEARDGSLWVGTSAGLLRLSADRRITHHLLEPGQGEHNVWALSVESEQVWAGHDGGLTRFAHPGDDSHARSVASVTYGEADGLPAKEVRALLRSTDERLYVGTAGGISVLTQGGVQTLTDNDRQPARLVIALSEDRDGNLWAGTYSSGALKVLRHGLVSYREGEGLGHTFINSIFEGPDRRLYVTSGQFSINVFDGDRFTAIVPNLPRHIVESEWQSYRRRPSIDHAGDWWVPTSSGLFRFAAVHDPRALAHARPKARYGTSDGLSSDDVSFVFEDSRRDIWIATRRARGAMLARWSRTTGAVEGYGADRGLPEFNEPFSIAEDRRGHIWIGFYDGGLARYAEGRFTLFGPTDGIPGGAVGALHVDKAGRLWVATGFGVARADHPEADTPRFQIYTSTDGLSGRGAGSIVEDGDGRIYFGTAGGIDRLDPATGRFRHFTMRDGLVSASVAAAFRDSRGHLWFGTPSGLSRMIPEPEREGSPPLVLVGAIRIAGDALHVSQLGESQVAGLELAPDRNRIDIDFLGLSFRTGENVRFQTYLRGADTDWSAPTTDAGVTYARLAPGTYQFAVRAVNVDGLVSAEPASVLFTVLRPFWQQWWFVALVVAAAATLTHLAYRARVRRVVALERVRTRIAADLHDDIGSSLSRIAILSEVVKRQLETAPHMVTGRLDEIADSARDLATSMGDIVWAVDPSRDDLGSLVARVREFAGGLLDLRGIAWELDAPATASRVAVPPEVRRHLFLVFKEALNNIVRHAECRHVHLAIRVEGPRLVAEIRDDGRGLPDHLLQADSGATPPRGHGLRNIRRRVQQIGAELRVSSTIGAGTTITVVAPIKVVA